MMKVLITGASGFVGSHLVEEISFWGWEIHAAVRKSSEITHIEKYVTKFVYLDQQRYDQVLELLEAECYDFIIHAAALTKAKSDIDLHQVNVGNTENILKAAFSIAQPPTRVVFVSSLAALGPISYEQEGALTEESSYHPVTAYGRSKRDAELMIKEKFSEQPITVFRPTAVYGPREKDLFLLFNTLHTGIDPYIGRQAQKLSFVYVKDLAKVLVLGCLVVQEGLQFYNISDGLVYSRYAMAEVYKETFFKTPLRLHIPYGIVSVFAKVSQFLYKNSAKTPTVYPERLGELTARNWSCAIDKAVEKLGYLPKYDLKKGLRETLLWYKENKWFR